MTLAGKEFSLSGWSNMRNYFMPISTIFTWKGPYIYFLHTWLGNPKGLCGLEILAILVWVLCIGCFHGGSWKHEYFGSLAN